VLADPGVDVAPLRTVDALDPLDAAPAALV
jgi:hypothetical protein